MSGKTIQCIRRHGFMLWSLGDVVIRMPPFAMTMDGLSQVVDALKFEIRAGLS
ncbi:MAG TPA: hypothetical protein VG722_02095 [Tepidisphaeraceae bacterium]|nr:hypothetical protein [Tepidisphaeraceae bacterium]